MLPSLRPWLRGYRLVTCALVLVAAGVQFTQSVVHQSRPAGNFFSFFTIQSNLIAAAAMAWLALAPRTASGWSGLDRLRVSVALYLAVTFIVYGLLLSNLQEQLQMTIPWVDTVLHKIVPALVVADWLLDPPHSGLTYRSSLVALVFPVAWLAYTMVRGLTANWYPYPFLDPGQPGGYAAVALYSVAITIGASLVLWMLLATGLRVRRAIRTANT